MANGENKDELEDNDNLNQGGNENINDADDNFGLPEIDYEPINRTTEEEEPDEVQPEEVKEEETYIPEEETPATYEETPYEEEVVAEETYEETVYQEEEIDYESEPQGYVPGSYEPEENKSNAGIIIGIIVIVVLLLGAVGYYFFSYKPAQVEKEQQRIEAQKKKEAEEKQKAAQAELERQRALEEQAAAEAAAREAEDAKPKIGSVETISSRTGRYYIVIASALDGDLAMDHAKKLTKKGISSYIIEPFGKSKFHRIAVGSYETWAEADNAANDFKPEYGDDVWVVRY